MQDDDLLADQHEAARLEGSWVCPETAACFSAVRALRRRNWLAEDDEVVILSTGAGVKYPESLPADVPLLTTKDRIPGPV